MGSPRAEDFRTLVAKAVLALCQHLESPQQKSAAQGSSTLPLHRSPSPVLPNAHGGWYSLEGITSHS